MMIVLPPPLSLSTSSGGATRPVKKLFWFSLVLVFLIALLTLQDDIQNIYQADNDYTRTLSLRATTGGQGGATRIGDNNNDTTTTTTTTTTDKTHSPSRSPSAVSPSDSPSIGPSDSPTASPTSGFPSVRPSRTPIKASPKTAGATLPGPQTATDTTTTAIISPPQAPPPSQLIPIPQNPDYARANDILSIHHWPEQSKLVVTFRSNATCPRPYLMGRLSGPTLVKIDGWTWRKEVEDRSSTTTVTILEGTYNNKVSTVVAGTYFIEIVSIYCDNFFYDYLEQTTKKTNTDTVVDPMSPEMIQMRSFDFKKVCVDDPINHRLTTDDASIHVTHVPDTTDTASTMAPATSWNGYWYNTAMEEATTSPGVPVVVPVHTRFQPLSCFITRPGKRDKLGLPHYTKEQCDFFTNRTIIQNYQFRWQTSSSSSSVPPLTTELINESLTKRGGVDSDDRQGIKICFVGASHSRELTIGADNAGLSNINVHSSHFYARYPSNVTKEVVRRIVRWNCHSIVIAIGQWPASFARSMLLEEYYQEVTQMLQRLEDANIDMNRVFLRSIHYNPLFADINSCPPNDWRNPLVLDGYNAVLQQVIQQQAYLKKVRFLDTDFMVGQLWDDAPDWRHLDAIPTSLEALYIAAVVLGVEPPPPPTPSLPTSTIPSGPTTATDAATTSGSSIISSIPPQAPPSAIPIPQNSDYARADDILSIQHWPEQSKLVVMLRSNATCPRPYLMGRLSGPTLVKVDGWTWTKSSDTSVLEGTYKVSVGGTYFIEIVSIYCDNFFYDFLEQTANTNTAVVDPMGPEMIQMRSFDFKKVCVDDPINHRLTTDNASIDIQVPVPGIDTTSATGTTTSWTGYWYNPVIEDASSPGVPVPVHTRFQPISCWPGKGRIKGLPDYTKEQCEFFTNRTIIQNYQFRWQTSSSVPLTAELIKESLTKRGLGTGRRSHIKICFVGASHSRELKDGAINAGLSNINVHSKHLYVRYPSNVTKEVARDIVHQNCHSIVIAIGQWPASFARSMLLEEYYQEVKQMLQRLEDASIDMNRVFLRSIHYNPLFADINKCPPNDWRNPLILDGYNAVLQQVIQQAQPKVLFLDTDSLVGQLWDDAPDWRHLDSIPSKLEALYIAAAVLGVEPPPRLSLPTTTTITSGPTATNATTTASGIISSPPSAPIPIPQNLQRQADHPKKDEEKKLMKLAKAVAVKEEKNSNPIIMTAGTTNSPTINGIPSCRRAWPFFPTWHKTYDYENAYFTPSNDTGSNINEFYPCQMPPKLTKEETANCLQNRKLFLLGNSIARQFAFHVPFLLGSSGEAPDLKTQKEYCSGGRCSIDAPYNVAIRSYWFLYWNGKPKLPPLPDSRIKPVWEADVCGTQSIDQCLIGIFQQDKPSINDILVTNVGIIYTLFDPSGVTNVHAWRVQQVQEFIRALKQHFPGTIIWMTGSKQKVRTPGKFRGNGDKDFYYADERTKVLDLQITPIVQQETNWTIYDGYDITEPLSYHKNPSYFVDEIHHPGRLTQVGWEYILGYSCKSSLVAQPPQVTVRRPS